MNTTPYRYLIKDMLPGYYQGPDYQFLSLKGNGVCWTVSNPSTGMASAVLGLYHALQKDAYRVHLYDDGRIDIDLITGEDYTTNQKRLQRVRERLRDMDS